MVKEKTNCGRYTVLVLTHSCGTVVSRYFVLAQSIPEPYANSYTSTFMPKLCLRVDYLSKLAIIRIQHPYIDRWVCTDSLNNKYLSTQNYFKVTAENVNSSAEAGQDVNFEGKN